MTFWTAVGNWDKHKKYTRKEKGINTGFSNVMEIYPNFACTVTEHHATEICRSQYVEKLKQNPK